MTRRSYLRRVASPLAPGEPVLFPVPGPAPGEARPVGPGGASLPGSGTAKAVVDRPAPRRASTRTAGAPHASLAPEIDGAAAPVPAGNSEIVAAPLPALWTQAPPPAAPAVPAAIGVAGVPAASAGTVAAKVAVERDVTMPTTEATAALDWGAPVVFRATQVSRPVAAPAPNVAARGDAADTSRPPRPAPGHPAEAYFQPAERAAEPHARAKPAPTARLRETASSSPPRIYIGTFEVRTSPAPAPTPATPPAPRPTPSAASAAPVTRGYGWRFGLVQG